MYVKKHFLFWWEKPNVHEPVSISMKWTSVGPQGFTSKMKQKGAHFNFNLNIHCWLSAWQTYFKYKQRSMFFDYVYSKKKKKQNIRMYL